MLTSALHVLCVLQLESLNQSELASRLTLNCQNSYVEPHKIKDSANWYLRFISLWALSPGSRGKNCLVGLNCKQLSLWSAPFALTLFELCFPLAFWEPFALFLCVEKEKGCVLHTFFKVWCMFPHANPNTQSYTQTHFLLCARWCFQARSVGTWTSGCFFLLLFVLKREVYRLAPICKQVWTTCTH